MSRRLGAFAGTSLVPGRTISDIPTSERIASVVAELQSILVVADANQLKAMYSQLSGVLMETQAAFMFAMAPKSEGGLLNAQQAGKLLGVTEGWIRRHTHELPSHRLSDGTVRFDPKELRRWWEGR